jgi:hypothetical protein
MELANAAMPLVSGLAEGIGSLFPHTETTIQQATVPVPNLTPAQKAKFLKRMQVGRGGKMNKQDKGGNFFSENILPAMSFGLLGGEVKPKTYGFEIAIATEFRDISHAEVTLCAVLSQLFK